MQYCIIEHHPGHSRRRAAGPVAEAVSERDLATALIYYTMLCYTILCYTMLYYAIIYYAIL